MKVTHDAHLSKYTTIGIGGLVKEVYQPENIEELLHCMQDTLTQEIPYFMLAGGSNTVFADEELVYDQRVILLDQLSHIQQTGALYECGPGASLQSLVDLAQQNTHVGVTGLNRIPGSIGGAVVGNAGAYGCEIGDVVTKVDCLNLEKLKMGVISFTSFLKKECEFGYRDTVFKHKENLLLVNISLQLTPAEHFEEEQKKYSEIAAKRDTVYPVGLLSPGSTFKNMFFSQLPIDVQQNIPSDWVVYGDKLPAGKLLEEVGAKGYRVGQVHMRDTHANIMINDGDGTFAEVQQLVRELQEKVKDAFGINLVPEIRLVPGDFTLFEH